MADALDRLPRRWWSVELPGYRPRLSTYSAIPREALPPIERHLDPELRWLCSERPVAGSLADESSNPARPATSAELQTLVGGHGVRAPAAFGAFVRSPEPRRRVRSCTDCYLDLGDFAVPVADGGWLIHFLSDSQWVLHWLLYRSADEECVVATDAPTGFEIEGETIRTFDPAAGDGVVCADSFSEFLYRLWIENEIWFALAHENRPLSDEQRRYAEHFLR